MTCAPPAPVTITTRRHRGKIASIVATPAGYRVLVTRSTRRTEPTPRGLVQVAGTRILTDARYATLAEARSALEGAWAATAESTS